MNEDEIFAKMSRDIIRTMAIKNLKANPKIENKAEVQKDIEKITDEITASLLKNLKATGSNISERDFNSVLEKTLKDYFKN